MESYASNEPRIGIVKTAMGACAQFAVFTYAEMRLIADGFIFGT